MSRSAKATLTSLLDGYSAILRSSRLDETRQRRRANWQLYAAVTGSAVAMATSASAGTIQNSAGMIRNSNAAAALLSSSVQYVQAGFTQKSVVVQLTNGNNQDIGKSFKIGVREGSGGLGQSGAAFVAGSKLHFLMTAGGSFVGKIGAGVKAQISSGGAPGGNFLAGTQNIASQFLPNEQQGFAHGFVRPAGAQGSFSASNTGTAAFWFSTNGQKDYGWVQLEFTDGENPLARRVSEIDLAYQNLSASPEPSTGALAILAAGAAGVIALRRRRKTA